MAFLGDIQALYEICTAVQTKYEEIGNNKVFAKEIADRASRIQDQMDILKSKIPEHSSISRCVKELVKVFRDCSSYIDEFGEKGVRQWLINCLFSHRLSDQFNQLNNKISELCIELNLELQIKVLRFADPVEQEAVENVEKLKSFLQTRNVPVTIPPGLTPRGQLEHILKTYQSDLQQDSSLLDVVWTGSIENDTSLHAKYDRILNANRIDLSNFDPDTAAVLGDGTFATVYKFKHNGKVCAVKHFEKMAAKTQREILIIKREVAVMSMLQHSHIISFQGCNLDKGAIVLELAFCSLHEVLYEGKQLPYGVSLDTQAKLAVLAHVAEALWFIHERDIIHRDLKPMNVLLVQGQRVNEFAAKLCDFGVAHAADIGTYRTSRNSVVGTTAYLPPEVLVYEARTGPQYTAAMDVFALGLIANELWARVPPWERLDEEQIKSKLRAMERPPLMSAPTGDLQEQQIAKLIGSTAMGCWAQGPQARPLAKDLADWLRRLLQGESVDVDTALQQLALANLNVSSKASVATGSSTPTSTTPTTASSSSSPTDSAPIQAIIVPLNKLTSSQVVELLHTNYVDDKVVEKLRKGGTSGFHLVACANAADVEDLSGMRGLRAEARGLWKLIEKWQQEGVQATEVLSKHQKMIYSLLRLYNGGATDIAEFNALKREADRGDCIAAACVALLFNWGGVLQPSLKNDAESKRYAAIALKGLAERTKPATAVSSLVFHFGAKPCPISCYLLGKLYLDGVGCGVDNAKALKYLERAEDEPLALMNLAWLYSTGGEDDTFVKDEAKAIEFFEKARQASKGTVFEPYAELSWAYELPDAEDSKGFVTYRKYEAFDDAGCNYSLAILHEAGRGGAEKNPQLALQYATRAANQNHCRAWNLLGAFYENGIGTEANKEKAFECYQRAIDCYEKLSDAHLSVGYCLHNSIGTAENQARALQHFQRAADLNNRAAYGWLSKYYEEGLGGVTANMSSAIAWARKSFEGNNNDFQAEYRLGRLLLDAEGRLKNEKEGFKHVYRAAKEGKVAAAQNKVGLCCERGAGTAVDAARAFKWYGLAAQQSLPVAMYNYAVYLKNGTGCRADETAAVEWFLKAAAAGYDVAEGLDAEDKHWLAKAIHKGIGTAVDVAEAIKWYALALAEGCETAAESLDYVMKWCGEDAKTTVREQLRDALQNQESAHGEFFLGCIEENDKLAFKRFKRSAELGNADGQFRLGQCYAQGRGVAASSTLALQWNTKAANQGHAEAKKHPVEATAVKYKPRHVVVQRKK